jgi:cell division protein FtsB
MSRRPSRRAVLAAVLVLAVALLVSGSIIVGTLALIQTRDRADDIARAVRDRIAAVVAARHNDCQASNKVLAALRAEVRASKRTEPILYRLVPSLDTPEVHALVAAQRKRELRAFAARDCRTYALQAVPAGQRHQYQLPR